MLHRVLLTVDVLIDKDDTVYVVFFYILVGIDLLFYVYVCTFVLFLLAIVLSFLLRFTDSDYPFAIFEPTSGTCYVTLVSHGDKS
jgi:hypothetical protein